MNIADRFETGGETILSANAVRNRFRQPVFFRQLQRLPHCPAQILLGQRLRQIINRQNAYRSVKIIFITGLKQHFAHGFGCTPRFHPPRNQKTAARFKTAGLKTLGPEQEYFRIPGFIFHGDDRVATSAAGHPLHRTQGFRFKNLAAAIRFQFPNSCQMGIIDVTVQPGIIIQQVPNCYNLQTGKGFCPFGTDSL